MRRLGSTFAAVALSVLAATSPARAAGEFRLKLDADYRVWQSRSVHPVTIRPMLRLESRFRDSGLVLEKVFSGLRSDVLSWLSLQLYYAHKDSFYRDHQVWHMIVGDLIFHVRVWRLRLSDRNGNEFHIRPHFDYWFYRYRNNFDIHFDPGLSWLRLWVADEIRVDADEGRLNMNDVKAGLEFLVGRHLHIQAFYDLESKRRGKDYWTHTHVFQLMFVVRLGRKPRHKPVHRYE